MQRANRLQKLQLAWEHRKLAVDVRISQSQRQKGEVLEALKEIALLMQSSDLQNFKFEEFARRHFITLSQKLEHINFQLMALQSKRRDFYGHEKRVEKLHGQVKEEEAKEQAAHEIAEILETALISEARENRKLATSQK